MPGAKGRQVGWRSEWSRAERSGREQGAHCCVERQRDVESRLNRAVLMNHDGRAVSTRPKVRSGRVGRASKETGV